MYQNQAFQTFQNHWIISHTYITSDTSHKLTTTFSEFTMSGLHKNTLFPISKTTLKFGAHSCTKYRGSIKLLIFWTETLTLNFHTYLKCNVSTGTKVIFHVQTFHHLDKIYSKLGTHVFLHNKDVKYTTSLYFWGPMFVVKKVHLAESGDLIFSDVILLRNYIPKKQKAD